MDVPASMAASPTYSAPSTTRPSGASGRRQSGAPSDTLDVRLVLLI